MTAKKKRSALKREVSFLTGYDHRDEKNDRHGAHGMTIRFVLSGEHGAITAAINTGWMARPLVSNYLPGGAQKRRTKPGVDAALVDIFPTAGPVGSHSHEKLSDYWGGPWPCDVLGGECYGDVGYLMGDDFLSRLITEGEEAAWAYLELTYIEWLTPEPAVSS